MPDTPAFRNALPDAERGELVLSCQGMCKSIARKALGDVPGLDIEDVEQEALLSCVMASQRWDPTRGVKFITYAHKCVAREVNKIVIAHRSRGEVQTDDWDLTAVVDPASVDEQNDDDATGGQLHKAVQRQLATGMLDVLEPRQKKASGPERALPARAIVEAVVFDAVTAEQLATQTGQAAKAVRANLKNAIRKLKTKGLIRHVATDAQVEAILAPNERLKHCNKPKPKQFAPEPPPPRADAA
jgi:RNA polymerase sigma factor (sigma-70 family)